jgi:uncharacterized protein (DUF2141 family)
MNRRLLILFVLALMSASMVFAQTGNGQVCVRVFEDRNGNGQQDNNEPFITRGISATLANADGIIVSTALIEDSPNAANGTLCFQRLTAGQYAIRLASADYSATTPNEFVTAVAEGGLPQVFPFGGQIIASTPVIDQAAAEAAELAARTNRLITAGIGGAIAVGVMLLLGIFIYLILVLQSRSSAKNRYAPVAAATGSYPAARPATGSYPAARPATGSYPAAAPQQNSYAMYDDDDTGKSRPVNPPVQQPIQPVEHLPYDSVDDFRFEDDADSPYRPPRD